MDVEDEAPDAGADASDELSIEATVAAAFDAHDKAEAGGAESSTEDTAEVPSLADESEKTPTAKGAPVKDPLTGKFTKQAAKAPAKEVTPKSSDQTSVKPQAGVVPPEALKPPRSWKETVQSKWSTLPPEVQQEIHRREKETAIALQGASQVRQFQEQFQQVAAPYEALIRSEGGNPLGAFKNFLETAATLRMGRPEMKAKVIADIVKAHGISIDALDSALAGQAPAQSQQTFQDPRVDQLLAQLQQAGQQRQQSFQQKQAEELAAFANGKDFLESDDFRHRMADVLEGAGRRGQKMTLEQAYDAACWMDPGTRDILQQRKAAEAAKNAQASTQRTKAAASSVRGKPVGQIKLDPKGESLEDTVAAAFDAHGY